ELYVGFGLRGQPFRRNPQFNRVLPGLADGMTARRQLREGRADRQEQADGKHGDARRGASSESGHGKSLSRITSPGPSFARRGVSSQRAVPSPYEGEG